MYLAFEQICTCVRASESHKYAAAVSAILDWTLGLLEFTKKIDVSFIVYAFAIVVYVLEI